MTTMKGMNDLIMNKKTSDNSNPVTINGILNIKWLQEQAKQMTPEKEKAIIARNEALRNIPYKKRKQWLEENPLDSFIEQDEYER